MLLKHRNVFWVQPQNMGVLTKHFHIFLVYMLEKISVGYLSGHNTLARASLCKFTVSSLKSLFYIL